MHPSICFQQTKREAVAFGVALHHFGRRRLVAAVLFVDVDAEEVSKRNGENPGEMAWLDGNIRRKLSWFKHVQTC